MLTAKTTSLQQKLRVYGETCVEIAELIETQYFGKICLNLYQNRKYWPVYSKNYEFTVKTTSYYENYELTAKNTILPWKQQLVSKKKSSSLERKLLVCSENYLLSRNAVDYYEY